MRRWLVRLGVGAVVLVLIVIVAAKLLLRTGFATNQVAAKIQEATGAPVHVGSLDVGITGSSLKNVQFPQVDAAPGSPPWADVAEIDAGVSLPQLIRGDVAGAPLTLRHPKLLLQFNSDDKLLTKLPSFAGPSMGWPVFHLVDGQITIQREGLPDAVFTGISATLQKTGDDITLTGTTNDPEWGDWTIAGGRANANTPFNLTLNTGDFRATPEKMRRVPFVPPATWEEVSLHGDTPVDLTVQFGGPSNGSAVRYRVVLTPKDLTVAVRAIDATIHDTAGKAVIQDGLVTLTNLTGNTAGGLLHLPKGVLDFRGEGSEQQYVVTGERLKLRDLPKKWGLPAWDGRLSGQANLTVSIRDGQMQTQGGGSGVIEGFLSQKIEVKLIANDQGYRFDITDAPKPAAPAGEGFAPRSLVLGLVAVQPPPVRPASAKTISVNIGLTDVNVAELVRKLNLKLPVHPDGRVTFHIQATIPLNDPKDLKIYHATGTVEMPWARIDEFWLQQVTTRVTLENGILRLEDLSARAPNPPPTAPPTQLLPGGTINGTVSADIAAVGELSANLKAVALPVGPLLKSMADGDPNGAGILNGEIQFQTPQMREPSKWSGSGRVVVRGLRAFGRSADEVDVQANAGDGVLHVSQARVALGNTAATGSGQATLSGKYPFQARLDLPPTDVQALQRLAMESQSVRLGGRGQATAEAHGTIQPFDFQANGNAHVVDLAVDNFGVGNIDFRWAADPQRLALNDFTATLYGGQLTGMASLPLKSTVAGKIDLTLNKVDTAQLTKGVPQTPVRLEGKAQGSVVVDMPPAQPNGERPITGDINIQADKLSVQNIPADRLKANVVYRGGVADYQITGETLGGTFDLNGRYPGGPPTARGQQGQVQIRHIDLAQLGQALRNDALRPLAGRFSFDAKITNVANLTGTGNVSLSGLAWGGKPVANHLSSTINIGNGAIRVNELGGQLAGGSVRIRADYNFRRPEESTASLRADNVDGRTLMAPFTSKPPVEGPLEIRLYTRLGREMTGTGQIILGYGKLLGITVRDAQFPLGWDVALGHRGMLRLHDAGAQASRGRLTAQANLLWGDTARLDGQILFNSLDIAEMLSHYSQTKVISGLASGRVDLSGQSMRSAQDLNARVIAKLSQAVPGQSPVFQQIMPMILPGVGSNVQFQSGDLRGQLSHGVFRIERLTLVGDMARIHADGTVTLQERLNLNVVANTNQMGIDPAALQLLGTTLPTVGPIPLGALNTAVSYLSNRTISVRVTGTAKAPSVRVNPVPLLTQSAVQFFLAQSGVPIPSAALQGQGP